MSGVQMIEVSADGDQKRLDRWLRGLFPQLGQGRIEKMCRKGEIRVDGSRAKASTRIEEGQIIRVPPIAAGPKPKPSERAQISEVDAQMMRDAVLYKDDHLIVLNKPAGLAVQGGSKQTRHVDALSEALKFGLEDKPKLVHRLDKDTSGLLLLARTGKAAAGLTKAFQSRTTRKVYWALVAGCPSPKLGTIKYGLVKQAGHGPHGAGEKMICVHPKEVETTPGAKHATSDYYVLEDLGKRAAWVALVPVTGRTHQLRAHMAEIGAPVIGDGKYGGNSQVNEGDGWGAQLGGDISRKLHLHARYLSFNHPVTRKLMQFKAPLSDHMAKTWKEFSWHENDVDDDPFDALTRT